MYIIDDQSIDGFIGAMLRPGQNSIVSAVFDSSCTRTIKSKDDIIAACNAVYEAGVPFRRRGRERQQYIVENVNHESVLSMLAEQIYNYFNHSPNTTNTQADFDLFHMNLCSSFLREINAARRDHCIDSFSYGNVQKLVNMIFKYLTTFKDYKQFCDLFKYCHMPIDANIIYYLDKKMAVSGCRGTVQREATRYGISASYNGTAWTKLEPCKYYKLVEEYRSALQKRYPNYSMLHLEYYIWKTVSDYLHEINRNQQKDIELMDIDPCGQDTMPGIITEFYM